MISQGERDHGSGSDVLRDHGCDLERRSNAHQGCGFVRVGATQNLGPPAWILFQHAVFAIGLSIRQEGLRKAYLCREKFSNLRSPHNFLIGAGPQDV